MLRMRLLATYFHQYDISKYHERVLAVTSGSDMHVALNPTVYSPLFAAVLLLLWSSNHWL